MSSTPPPRPSSRRTVWVATAATVASLSMLALSFASPPLYRLFCAATGYGGATQVATSASPRLGQRTLTVRLDANVAPGLDWRFEPETPEIRVRSGQTATVFFKISNRSDKPTAGVAAYNVGPDSAGAYFNKISCFCFNEMRLSGRETAELPVVFFLDPSLEADATLAGVDTVVLSYTLFPAKPSGSLASGGRSAGGKPL